MRNLILFLLIIFPFIFFGQGENNNWYFGTAAGVSFPNGSLTTSPIILTNANNLFSTNHSFFSSFCPQESGYNHIYDNSIGGAATISDSNGDLLFYTDGVNVFNKNHQMMLNGNDIGLNDTPSKQHAIIVPHTQNKDLYYIFSAFPPLLLVPQNAIGIGVSLVSFENNSLGEVIWKKAKIESIVQSNQAITATYSSDNNSIWILVPYDGFSPLNDKLHTFKLDLNSISTYNCNNNLCVQIDEFISDLDISLSPYSEIKISPDKTKISITVPTRQYGVSTPKSKVYGFDNSTGLISNSYQFNIDGKFVYSSEFSSDSKLLYAIIDNISCLQSCGGIYPEHRLVVFDLSNQNTPYRIISDIVVYGSLQRAIDGNIYFTNRDNKLYKIDNHNSFLNSSISASVIDLGQYKCSLFGLPQLVPVKESFCSDLNLISETHTGEYIYIDYNNITTSQNYILDNITQDISMYAQNNITLSPNTYMKLGIKFLAAIEDCSSTRPMMRLGNGMEQIEEKTSFEIILNPNPASTEVSVKTNQKIKKVVIFSIDGYPVYEKEEKSSLEELKIDVSNFKKGIYLFKLTNIHGDKLFKRLVIN